MENSILHHRKIVSLETLIPIVKQLQHQKKKIVFTNGCYDILHPGHLHLLTLAKAQGDVLVVGLNSDSSVQQQGKVFHRPITPFYDRAYMLAHLEPVDFILQFEEKTPLRLIETISPDILVKGGDWPVETIVGREHVEKNNGHTVCLDLLPGYSTTKLIEKIKKIPI